MGFVYAEIKLKNAYDISSFKRGFIKEEDIRQITVKALVDTGAGTLVINEELRQRLGLGIEGTRRAVLANNTKESVNIVEPVEIHWNDRNSICKPLSASNSGEVLLGAIPLEDMDLIVDPVRQILVGAHGDEVVSLLM